MVNLKTLKIIPLLLLTGLLWSHSARAFDGNRQGFQLGLGLGAHGSEFANESETGVGSNFKIGWGITNQFSIYYVNYVSWFNAGGYLYTSALSGVGGAFYFSPTRPSFYLTAAVGAASLNGIDTDDDLVDNSASGDGGGVAFGFGFELRKLLSFEATFVVSNIDYDNSILGDQDHNSVLLTANMGFY